MQFALAPPAWPVYNGPCQKIRAGAAGGPGPGGRDTQQKRNNLREPPKKTEQKPKSAGKSQQFTLGLNCRRHEPNSNSTAATGTDTF